MIETLLTFADKVGCRIVAEGIETEAELTCLLRLGVHYGQGFFLGRPEDQPAPLSEAAQVVLAAGAERAVDGLKCASPIHALQKAGWEVASHSLTHKRPVDIPRFYSEEKCLTLRPVSGQRALFEGKYHYEELAGLIEDGRLLRERSSGRQVRHGLLHRLRSWRPVRQRQHPVSQRLAQAGREFQPDPAG